MPKCKKYTVTRTIVITEEMDAHFIEISKYTRIPVATIMRECLYRGLKVAYDRDVDDVE